MQLVGLDIETTGLVAAEAEIIEVAAIRFDLTSSKEIDSFTRLCRAEALLSPTVISITGITPEMISAKPLFKEVKEELRQFVGSDIVLAHNASFDLGFLAHHGCELTNAVWDTFFIAGVALPSAPSYNLGNLAKLLGIASTTEHRAADDVRMTWQVLRALRERLTLAPELLREVTDILHKGQLAHYAPLFSSASSLPGHEKVHAVAADPPPPVALDQLDSAAILGEKGLLAQRLPGFSYRPEQVKMAAQTRLTLEGQGTALIEAGTGIGKTFGYLIPSLQICLKQTNPSLPVVISTYTRHLQDQLVTADLPRLLAAFNLSLPWALLKGRSNYVCNRCLDRYLQHARFTPAEAWVLLKIVVWLRGGGTGDIEELNFSHQRLRLIHQLTADSAYCRSYCTAASRCPYQTALLRVRKASLIIVNHALLTQLGTTLQDIPLRYLVIDEAHHLPQAARLSTQRSLAIERLEEILDDSIANLAAVETPFKQHLATEATALVSEYRQLLARAGEFTLLSSAAGVLTLNPEIRKSSSWHKLSQQATSWLSRLTFILGMFRSFLEQHPTARFADVIQDLEQFDRDFSQFIEGSNDRIQWIEATPLNTTLHDVAASIHQSVERIFKKDNGVVLTSATLTTGGNFSYIKNLLGIEDATALQLPSSFQYRDNMLIYLLEHAPQPGSDLFEPFSARILEQVARLLGGRTLALLTSKKSVSGLYRLLINSLYKANIRLLAQKITGGRHTIMDRFRRDARTVVLGTASFWEGIDIPGPGLSALVIPKLPFATPYDPIMSRLAQASTGNAFANFALPHMLLRLRQGIGRLLRSPDDRGVVILLDPRILTAQYRHDILSSLPPATIKIGTDQELIPTITDWFGTETVEGWGKVGT